jgi:hypothetical protein
LESQKIQAGKFPCGIFVVFFGQNGEFLLDFGSEYTIWIPRNRWEGRKMARNCRASQWDSTRPV